MIITTVFVFFTVAFVGLAYFAFNLQGQISTLSMHLEPGKRLRNTKVKYYNGYCNNTPILSSETNKYFLIRYAFKSKHMFI